MKTSRLPVAPQVPTEPVQVVGQIVGQSAAGWMVEGTDCRFPCRLATSCLLQPVEGDRVLAVCAGEQAWILAVLEREHVHDHELSIKGNLKLIADGGKLSLSGSGDVAVEAGGALHLKAVTFSLAANLADLVCRQARWMTEKMKLQFNSLGLFGHSMDAVTQRYSQTSKTALRNIEQLDQLKAGMVDYRAESLMNLRGRNVVTQARELAKINADQVHLG